MSVARMAARGHGPLNEDRIVERALLSIERWWVSVALAVALLGCGAPQAGVGSIDDACEGYPCTAAGARAMLTEILAHSGKSLQGARPEVDKLLEHAVRRMGERGYTPADFKLAAQNMTRLMKSSPHGAEATTARELEKVNRSKHWLCPLWPLC